MSLGLERYVQRAGQSLKLKDVYNFGAWGVLNMGGRP